jgi:hypothetical protein
MITFEVFRIDCFRVSPKALQHIQHTKRRPKLGTGLTAALAISELAKWAKELYVFQRTPSAVDIRTTNRPTCSSSTRKYVVVVKAGREEDHRNSMPICRTIPSVKTYLMISEPKCWRSASRAVVLAFVPALVKWTVSIPNGLKRW